MIYVLGFTGKAGSGKDTCADYLANVFQFQKLSWAAPLKEALAAMGFPEPRRREMKEVQIPGFDFSWRQAAQALGTEWGRALDPDIWVKMVERDIRACEARGAPTRFVISDVRFENEAAAIRRMGGIVVHLTGRAADLGGAAGHASEAGVEYFPSRDAIIENTGSIVDLHAQIRVILAERSSS